VAWKTRFIRLGKQQRRERGSNQRTQSFGAFKDLLPSRSFRGLFERNYVDIRGMCLEFDQPGLAIVAVEPRRGRIAASCCIAARPDLPAVAFIGRHNRTDLFLEGDDSLSLRHLAVVVHPLESWDPHRIRFTVLDLRTSGAFEDEHGNKLEGLVAEGPVFLGCGRFKLMLLVTGDPADWPMSSSESWEQIPDRVPLEAAMAEPDRWQRQQPGPALGGTSVPSAPNGKALRRRTTLVTHLDGPAYAGAGMLGDDEEPVGRLTATVHGFARSTLVGPRAIDQGVLLGRYERCDQSQLLVDERISRVHLLIRRFGQRIYAIDTASTHRTFLNDPAVGHRSVRVVPLDEPRDLVLGPGYASIRWSPAPQQLPMLPAAGPTSSPSIAIAEVPLSQAVPSEAVRNEAAPSQAVPGHAAPSQAVPSHTLASRMEAGESPPGGSPAGGAAPVVREATPVMSDVTPVIARDPTPTPV
jgi:hypothetical protein